MSFDISMGNGQWFVLDVNPYPWKVPPFSVGRKAGRSFVVAGRDQGLHAYKEAIREQLDIQGYEKIEGDIAIFFWYYRRIDKYTTGGRKSRSHVADTTNLQKATEDAFQEYVFENDKAVVVTQSWRVEQSEDVTPFVVAYVAPFLGGRPTFPDTVQSRVEELLNRDSTARAPYITPDEEIPF